MTDELQDDEALELYNKQTKPTLEVHGAYMYRSGSDHLVKHRCVLCNFLVASCELMATNDNKPVCWECIYDKAERYVKCVN